MDSGNAKSTAPVDAVVMRQGLPLADADGAYWWFRPASTIMPEVQALFVRWVRGAVRAVYGGELVKVTAMDGEWCGPIPWPTCWDTCEHGVADGDWCDSCNREYKRAARANE